VGLEPRQAETTVNAETEASSAGTGGNRAGRSTPERLELINRDIWKPFLQHFLSTALPLGLRD
jgi:hypothetical protein